MRNMDWQSMVNGLLKTEMKRRNMTYEQLTEIGVTDTAQDLRTKVSRGGFSAAFFVQCLWLSCSLFYSVRS